MLLFYFNLCQKLTSLRLMHLRRSLVKWSFLSRAKPHYVSYPYFGKIYGPWFDYKWQQIRTFQDRSNKNWMRNLEEFMKDLPIVYLAIPGAHDSMTYTITPVSEVSPDNASPVQIMVALFGWLARKHIYKWCITQEVDVVEQLNLGIRYLDFRVATKTYDSNIYFCHGLYGDEVSTNLYKIKQFLDENKEEVVILDFQHFYSFTGNDHENLIYKQIKKIFGSELCEYPSDISDVSLRRMLQNGNRVIVIYREYGIEQIKIPGLWPGPAWPTPWPNTTSVNTLYTFLDQSLAGRSVGKGHVSQCLLTPSLESVALHPMGTLRDEYAIPVLNNVITPWTRQQHPGRTGVNVIVADFVNFGEFADNVIRINKQLPR